MRIIIIEILIISKIPVSSDHRKIIGFYAEQAIFDFHFSPRAAHSSQTAGTTIMIRLVIV